LSAVNSWFNTCGALSRRWVVRLVYSAATVLVSIIVLGSTTLPQSDSGSPGVSANELARKIVTNELKFQDEDHGHWMYRLEKEESGKKQVQEIVETGTGRGLTNSAVNMNRYWRFVLFLGNIRLPERGPVTLAYRERRLSYASPT
jgi:hypothetical protein